MSTQIILEMAVKSTALLLAIFGAQALWRGASAAKRSLLWLAAFAGLSLLPLTLLVQPQWTLGGGEAAQAVPQSRYLLIATTEAGPEAAGTSESEGGTKTVTGLRMKPAEVAVGVWMAGALAILAYRLLGSWRLRLLRAESRVCDDTRLLRLAAICAAEQKIELSVEIRTGPSLTVPVTWGLAKPVLLLPDEAANWSEERVRAALLHELAHVRHGDVAARLLATWASALHWPNPLIWIGARAWRAEQEKSADDVVLKAGAGAKGYAMQLLEAARGCRQARLGRSPALAMARAATLERRLAAIMEEGRDRRSAGQREAWAVSAAAVLAMAGLSSLGLAEQPGKAPVAAPAAKAEEKLIAVQLRVLETTQGQVPERFSAASGQALPTGEADALLDAALKDDRARVSVFPRLITRNRAEASLRSVVSVPLPNGELLPIGQLFEILPILQRDSVDLSVDATISEQIGEDNGLPVVSSQQSSFSVRVPAGQTAIAVLSQDKSVQPPKAPDKAYVLLVTAHSLVAADPAGQSPLQERAEEILLPSVQFRNASLEEVAEFLRVKSRQQSLKRQAVNIVVAGTEPGAKITLSRQVITLHDLLREVARQAKAQLRYVANAAVLGSGPPLGGVALGYESAPAMIEAASIIFPRVQFKEATLSEAIQWVSVSSRSQAKGGGGLGIVMGGGEGVAQRRISLNLELVSALDLLHHIGTLAGCSVTAENNGLVLTPAAARSE